MVIIQLMGGLGNQFFQYAFARKLQLSGIEVAFDLSWFKECPLSHGKYQLNLYHTVVFEYMDDAMQALKVETEIPFLSYDSSMLNTKYIRIYETDNKFYPALLKCDNSIVQGYFQSEKYFRDIRNMLLKELDLKEFHDLTNLQFLDEIKNTTSVSVHIRRGDYLNYTNIYGGICTEKYYLAAMNYMEKMLEDIEFFVFSDDLLWCREFLKSYSNVTYVDANSNLQGYNDLQLMKHCKHNIIANSSFSWWGAWLNAHPDKIVISPDKWLFHNVLPDIKCIGWTYINEEGEVV